MGKSYRLMAQNEMIDGHEYVDLGLPSGTLWATCNVGADKPEEPGDYFSWGDTEPKEEWECTPSDYKFDDDDNRGFTKYNEEEGTLLPEDDAATANWGDGWRMPNEAEAEELLENTTREWTMLNGRAGMLFTAKNGKTLFLPAAGFYDFEDGHLAGGEEGWYSLNSYNERDRAVCIYCRYKDCAWVANDNHRCCGQSVRTVRNI